MGFIYEPVNGIHLAHTNLHHIGIMYTAYTGFMLINIILLISRVIKDRIYFPTIVLFAISGAALFLITGILLTVDRLKFSGKIFHPRQYQLSMMTISICLSFVNATVFTIEAVFTCMRRQDL
ncbi:hypothetical protein Zmor_023574 [Zophobas morio]|uniref:Uncharacterized protein n=2 Tax=Zophobas morio TaxID=2755281 RepID=A0AA38I1D3_9CUCU|nr:hypothetical protein Zmor_023574 [Zophobas morio]